MLLTVYCSDPSFWYCWARIHAATYSVIQVSAHSSTGILCPCIFFLSFRCYLLQYPYLIYVFLLNKIGKMFIELSSNHFPSMSFSLKLFWAVMVGSDSYKASTSSIHMQHIQSILPFFKRLLMPRQSLNFLTALIHKHYLIFIFSTL